MEDMMMEVLILGIALAVFFAFSTFVLKEGARDEREDAHRTLSGRWAFFSGSAVLIAGIVYQSLADSLDYWLPAALAAMIVAKLIARLLLHRFK